MLASRALVTALLLPVGLALIVLGGTPFGLFVTLILALAGWEYWRLFRAGGLEPAGVLIPAGAALLAIGRMLDGFQSGPFLLSLLVLASMAYHLLMYERGRDQAGTDFGVTVAGILYFGWIGGYLIDLRNLPEGMWWVLLVLPSVWLADTGAYLVGSRFGRHKLSPRLSPKKSWEGYLAGIACAILGAPLLALGFQALGASPAVITPQRSAWLGGVLSVLTLLGDLGESMIKRQVGAKDSGKLLPGHGGVFDRIDSWLWAGVLGFYIITFFFR